MKITFLAERRTNFDKKRNTCILFERRKNSPSQQFENAKSTTQLTNQTSENYNKLGVDSAPERQTVNI